MAHIRSLLSSIVPLLAIYAHSQSVQIAAGREDVLGTGACQCHMWVFYLPTMFSTSACISRQDCAYVIPVVSAAPNTFVVVHAPECCVCEEFAVFVPKFVACCDRLPDSMHIVQRTE